MNIMVKGLVSGAGATFTALGASVPALARLVGVEWVLVWTQWNVLSLTPRFCFLSVFPTPLDFGHPRERSAYQTIDSSEAPTDFYAGVEGKAHTSQGY